MRVVLKYVKKFLLFQLPIWLILALYLTLKIGMAIGSDKGVLPTTGTQDSIASIEKVQKTVLVEAEIQKVVPKETAKKYIPLSGKKVLLVLKYKAQFGIEKPVKISKLGNSSYLVNVPKFQVIGVKHVQDGAQVYNVDKGILSSLADDIDVAKISNDEMTNQAQKKYLNKNVNWIKESAKTHYDQLIKAIDSDAKITYVFQN